MSTAPRVGVDDLRGTDFRRLPAADRKPRAFVRGRPGRHVDDHVRRQGHLAAARAGGRAAGDRVGLVQESRSRRVRSVRWNRRQASHGAVHLRQASRQRSQPFLLLGPLDELRRRELIVIVINPVPTVVHEAVAVIIHAVDQEQVLDVNRHGCCAVRVGTGKLGRGAGRSVVHEELGIGVASSAR